MQKQLIASAKEKGFESHIIGKSVEAKYSNKDFYYLWMCELQKWLREEHNIILIVKFETIDDSETAYTWNIIEYIEEGVGRKKDTWDFYKRTDYFSKRMMWWKIYEEALEEGLKEALKLI